MTSIYRSPYEGKLDNVACRKVPSRPVGHTGASDANELAATRMRKYIYISPLLFFSLFIFYQRDETRRGAAVAVFPLCDASISDLYRFVRPRRV